ncbi:MAG: hypothetical protein MJY45_06570 [Bacteroidales bacterium]|nr:hypothetical protein [Bacteroidales bacterium]
MKKFVSLIAAMLLSLTVFAQPRALGGRFAAGVEFSYQHDIGKNFIELDLGYNQATGFGLTAIYDFICATPAWTSKGSWDLYAGPGISLGTYFKTIPFAAGVCGQVGLSYTFWFPLQLSVDFRPMIGVGRSSDGTSFHAVGLLGFIPTAGVRYSFGQK